MQFPVNMPDHAKDLIDRMLQVDMSKRIGCGGSDSLNSFSSIKNHPFFNGVDFSKLSQTPVPIPREYIDAHLTPKPKQQRSYTVKREVKKIEEDIKEVTRGLLKKRNQFYIQ